MRTRLRNFRTSGGNGSPATGRESVIQVAGGNPVIVGVIGLSMRLTTCFAFLSLFLVGCDRAGSPARSPVQQTPVQTPEQYMAGWGEMGMQLPDAEQVKVFRNNFDSTRGALRDALSHSNHSVRMRAAYVIGEIGETAKPAGAELLARFADEPDELVRIYIIDALNAIDYGTEAAVTVLAERYKALDGTNVPPNDDHSYAEVDEKIKVASALYSFVDADTKSEYFNFVTKWLNPAADDLSGDLLEGYWERRWIAVNSLEQMPDATDAIPKLESLKAEPNAKSWVDVHVPRVLGVLQNNAR